MLSLYVKSSEVQLLRLRATIQDHSSIASILLEKVNFTHARDNGNPPLVIKLGLTWPSIKPGTWNIPEHAGTCRNIPEHSGTSRNIPEHEKIFKILKK